jgi:hypothetical protein
MKVELSLERLEQMQEVLGSDLQEIVTGVLASLCDAIEETERRMAEADLQAASKAAHAARNDALLVGAKDLLAALTALEEAARGGRAAFARAALATLHEVWPSTRAELTRVAARSNRPDSA